MFNYISEYNKLSPLKVETLTDFYIKIVDSHVECAKILLDSSSEILVQESNTVSFPYFWNAEISCSVLDIGETSLAINWANIICADIIQCEHTCVGKLGFNENIKVAKIGSYYISSNRNNAYQKLVEEAIENFPNLALLLCSYVPIYEKATKFITVNIVSSIFTGTLQHCSSLTCNENSGYRSIINDYNANNNIKMKDNHGFYSIEQLNEIINFLIIQLKMPLLKNACK
jgi:hypothetical protein